MKKGFTLIELLIVVAIIAILAAIAVPNFLEAQARAKISRAKADMRTCAMAEETYSIDQSVYAMGIIEFLNPQYRDNWGFLPVILTTPVAYLASMPLDAYNEHYIIYGSKAPSADARMGSYLTRYRISTRKVYPGANSAGQVKTQAQYDEGWTNWMRQMGGSPTSPYVLVSLGPDKVEDALPTYNPNGAVYDPSNGTISSGDIIYFGGGGIKGGK